MTPIVYVLGTLLATLIPAVALTCLLWCTPTTEGNIVRRTCRAMRRQDVSLVRAYFTLYAHWFSDEQCDRIQAWLDDAAAHPNCLDMYPDHLLPKEDEEEDEEEKKD